MARRKLQGPGAQARGEDRLQADAQDAAREGAAGGRLAWRGALADGQGHRRQRRPQITRPSTQRWNGGARLGFHEELVPLHQACAAAYHALVDGPRLAPSDLEEARGLVAIALSRVATLYRMSEETAVPLSESEIQQALFNS